MGLVPRGAESVEQLGGEALVPLELHEGRSMIMINQS